MKKVKDFSKINICTYNESTYPSNLKNIYDPPKCLFYKGNINLLNHKLIAIVGSRECSNYGKKIAIDFAYKLSRDGFIIVSGGARGIDTYAHLGALAAGKPTIMVLGNSLDYIYPPENKELEENIINKQGLIISEYMPITKPDKYTFPERNRIISGISDGVLIVEAAKESGAIITADFALEQGKEVFAIPGNITSKKSIGTNELIKQGAKIVTSVRDIIRDF